MKVAAEFFCGKNQIFKNNDCMFKSFLKTFSLEILLEISNQYFLIFKNKKIICGSKTYF